MKNAVVFLLLFVVACAHAPQQDVAHRYHPAVEEDNEAELPKQELTEQVLFKMLLADIAVQRDKSELGVDAYLDLVKTTRDPRVARYATHLAFETRQMDRAKEASRLWQELEPNSQRAKRMTVTLLLGEGKLNEARPHLANLLAAEPDNIAGNITQIYSMIARLPDKMASYNLINDLAQPYPNVAEARWALALLAEAAGKRELAMAEARKASDLRPEWDRALLLNAQLLLDALQQKQALALLKKYLATYPDNREVRLFYARTLMEQKQYPAARTEFQLLLDTYPDNADLAFTVALLSLEMGELDRADQELRQLLARGKKDESTLYYYLGRLSEAKQQEEEALQNYQKVQDGEYAFSARLRLAYLFGKAGKLEQARQTLRQIEAQDDPQRAQLIMSEAQILRDAKQQEESYQLLMQGQKQLPEQADLLYEAAMMADKTGRYDTFEQLMYKLIQLKPDYAHGYNALGYSLLDRNERVPEAMQLVEKAYQLAPEDAAIMDSVGWGHYRLGNLPKSLEFLRRAYNANPDPEIAAHLGEVLWVRGDKEEAKKIWQNALQAHSDNAVLVNVVKKFLP